MTPPTDPQPTPAGAPSHGDLSERDRVILKAVILAYMVDAEPVSSRAVAKRSDLGLSAATIRNVMADLADTGYLSQPHTSAGRVPTSAAYHLFIEEMMDGSSLPSPLRRYIREHLGTSPSDAEELMEATTHLLSELSSQVGIVVTPAMGETVLKAVDFVPLSGRKVLCVVVSSGGFVDNKVVETEEVIDRETLVEIGNYLNQHYAGQTLRQIRDRLLSAMAEERVQMDRLMALAIELARAGFDYEGSEQRVLHEGTSSLLHKPELADLDRVRQLLDTFANHNHLVLLLSQCIQGRGVRVTIGEESPLTSALDFSLVATTYGVGDEVLGSLGIFGPSRMEYQKVVPLVHYLGETLSSALAEVYGRER
jgi:heat-inducible transcriptional repressor